MNKLSNIIFIIVLVSSLSIYQASAQLNQTVQNAQTLCYETASLRAKLERQLSQLERVNTTVVQSDIDKYKVARQYMSNALDILFPLKTFLIQKKQKKQMTIQSSNSKSIQASIFSEFGKVASICGTYKSFGTKAYNKACSAFEQLQQNSGQVNYCSLTQTYNSEAARRQRPAGFDEQLVCQTVYIIELMGQIQGFLQSVLNDTRFDQLTNALQQVINSQKAQGCPLLQTRFVQVITFKSIGCLQIPQLQVFNSESQEVASKKSTSASSFYDNNNSPSFAVDGDARNFPTHPKQFHVAIAQCNDPTAWWQVDLGSNQVISRAVYYNRIDNSMERSVGYLVRLLDENKNIVSQKVMQGGRIETIIFDYSDIKINGSNLLNNSTNVFDRQVLYYKGVGSYKDTGDRALRFGPKQGGYNLETCSQACAGYKYFGLQYGTECYCENDFSSVTKYGKESCGQLGGVWCNYVYQQFNISASDLNSSNSIIPIGPFKDTADRSFRYGPQQYGYNVETCAKACEQYTFFALQDNGWCSCESDFASATKYGTSSCGQLGGGWCNYIYKRLK